MPNWSAPISLKGVKGDSTPQTLPNDLTPNSVAIAPVSGDSSASALTQRNASGTTVFASDPSGNVTCAGTLTAAGAAALAAVTASSVSTPSLTASTASISGNESVGGNLNVVGTLTAGALTASGSSIGGDQTITGNDTVNGNLLVKGSTSLQALTATSQQVSGTSSLGAVTCTSLSDTGGASITGTLNVGGTTTAKAVSATTVTTSGDLSVGGAGTFTGGVTVNSLNSNNNALVQGALTVNKGAQVIGAFTNSGSTNISGTMTCGAATVDSLASSGNIRTEANLTASTGSTLLNTLTASSASVVGRTTSGTLTVTGTSTLGATNAGALTATSANVSGTSTLATTTTGALTASSANVTGATTLAALTASSSSIAANESVGGTLSVTGATTLGALTAASSSITGSENVAATLTAKNLVLASGGGGSLTFADGTTMSTAASGGTGGASSGTAGVAYDTIYMGLHQANGNYPTAYTANNGYFVNTQWVSNTSVLATGSAYVSPYAGSVYSIEIFAVSASNPISVNLYKNGVSTSLTATSTTSGGAFYATASSPISVAAGDLLQLFIKGTTASMSNSCIGWLTMSAASGNIPRNPSFNSVTVAAVSGDTTPAIVTTPSLTLTSGGGGKLTFADGTTQATAASAATASGSRTAIALGTYMNTNQAAGSFWTLQTPTLNNNGNTISSMECFEQMPWAGSITGWCLEQYYNNGTNTFRLEKNRTAAANNVIATVTAGSATVTGFPGNKFSGTFAKGTYPFVAGDNFCAEVSWSTTSQCNAKLTIYVEWT